MSGLRERLAGEDWRRLSRIARLAVENDGALRGRAERQYVQRMHERLLAYREEAFVSKAQRRWLESIGRRLDRALAVEDAA